VYQALALLLKTPSIRVASVCVDAASEGELDFLRWARRHRPDVQFFVYSNRGDVEAMGLALRHGARSLDLEGMEGLLAGTNERRGEGTKGRPLLTQQWHTGRDGGTEAERGQQPSPPAPFPRAEGEATERPAAAGSLRERATEDERRRVVAEASRRHEEVVPLFGANGFELTEEVSDEEFEQTRAWPFRVCGVPDEEADEVGEVEAGSMAEADEVTGESAIVDEEAEGIEAALQSPEIEIEEEEDEDEDEDEEADQEEEEEDLRGPVRVPWLRYSDAPLRGGPEARDGGTEGRRDEVGNAKCEGSRDHGTEGSRDPGRAPSPLPLSRHGESQTQGTEGGRDEGTKGRDEGIEGSRDQGIKSGTPGEATSIPQSLNPSIPSSFDSRELLRFTFPRQHKDPF
jgi:hypothetical protein